MQKMSAAPATTGRTVVEPAGLRRRLASMLYEVLLLIGVLFLAFLVPHLILGWTTGWVFAGWMLWLHVFIVLGAYFVWYWHRHGATLAMQTWNLKVVDVRYGLPPAWGRAALRYLLTWPSLWCAGIGVWWAFFDKDRQFLHDRLAGTCIVLLPKPQKN